MRPRIVWTMPSARETATRAKRTRTIVFRVPIVAWAAGSWFVYDTETVREATFPAGSVAVAVMVFAPDDNGSWIENVPPLPKETP